MTRPRDLAMHMTKGEKMYITVSKDGKLLYEAPAITVLETDEHDIITTSDQGGAGGGSGGGSEGENDWTGEWDTEL